MNIDDRDLMLGGSDEVGAHVRAEVMRIGRLSDAEVYSDSWTCPKCGIGEMGNPDGYDACEPTDRVVCLDCEHICELRDILFVRGDIATLLDVLDEVIQENLSLRNGLDEAHACANE